MYAINRSAVVVKLKRPYLDWARRFGQTLEAEPAEQAAVYLFPEVESQAEAEAVLGKVFAAIFEHELSACGIDQALWPRERSVETFRQWFDIELSFDVFDLAEDDEAGQLGLLEDGEIDIG